MGDSRIPRTMSPVLTYDASTALKRARFWEGIGMRVEIDTVLEAFKGPLLLIDDDKERRRIELVIEASRPAVENAIYRVFTESLRGINESLDGARLELRLDGNAIDIEVVEEAEPELPESDYGISPGDVEKLTLRILEPLKKAAADAAAEEGRSLNNWISSALARSLERRQRRSRPDVRRTRRHSRRSSGGDVEETEEPEVRD
jgi:hypothetical protein